MRWEYEYENENGGGIRLAGSVDFDEACSRKRRKGGQMEMGREVNVDGWSLDAVFKIGILDDICSSRIPLWLCDLIAKLF